MVMWSGELRQRPISSTVRKIQYSQQKQLDCAMLEISLYLSADATLTNQLVKYTFRRGL